MKNDLENYFKPFRDNIVGINQTFKSPFGEQKIIYTDWTASGRLYKPIEDKLLNKFGPYVANTHTETSFTGATMTLAYHQARSIIKNHVNASKNDVLITEGSCMTGVINKFQRILGLRIPESLANYAMIPPELKPVVFITHMEHHSNQTSWEETIADVEIIPCQETGLVCFKSFKKLLNKYKDRTVKIASVTACSNVTGIQTDYHKIANMIHEAGGVCFVDFACSAPYVDIDMHPKKDKNGFLDAIFFSPHKFLGGPGSSGVLVFNKKLYHNMVPDNPGGGTVSYTNPWGEHIYLDDIELREDGGTPGFLQTTRAALAIRLKEKMGVKKILEREHELNTFIFNQLEGIENLHLLASQHRDRLGIFSFYVDDVHFNLIVKLLNDKYGIQTRGGCSCAGTYGHFLLHVDQHKSHDFMEQIEGGCLVERPGWIRMSIHPTITNKQIIYVCNSIKEVAANYKIWQDDYSYVAANNEFEYVNKDNAAKNLIKYWFNLDE